MTKRALSSLILALALAVPGLSGQAQATERPPQVVVLSSAVDAISRMHMDEFTQTVLWGGAIDGVYEVLARRTVARDAEDAVPGSEISTAASRDSVVALYESRLSEASEMVRDEYGHLFRTSGSAEWR